jgi:hypothetical protein
MAGQDSPLGIEQSLSNGPWVERILLEVQLLNGLQKTGRVAR